MASTKGTFLSLGASGKLAKQVVASKWKGKKTVREYVVPTNPQTVAQQSQRTVFADANDAFRARLANSNIREAWNTKAKSIKRTMSGYNAAMSALKNVLSLDASASFATSVPPVAAFYPTSLIHYPMHDDAADTVITDLSAVNVNGTLVGGNTEDISVSGPTGKALLFDRASFYVNGNPFAFGANMTLCVWFQYVAISQILFGNSASGREFIRTTTSNRAQYYATALDTYTATMPALAANTWHWLCFIRTANSNQFWIDNVASITAPLNSANPITVNRVAAGNSIPPDPYSCPLDDARCYSHAFTSEQRDLVYNSGKGTVDRFSGGLQSFTFHNMDDGAEGNEAGNFDVFVGEKSGSRLKVGEEAILRGSIDFSAYVVNPLLNFIEIRKAGLSRTGILRIPR